MVTQPRVRPFGTCHLFENKVYIQTGKSKDVSKQMKKNPKVEICGMAEGHGYGSQLPRLKMTG